MRRTWLQLLLGIGVGAITAFGVTQWNSGRARDADASFRASVEQELARRDDRGAATLAIESVARAHAEPVAPTPAAPHPQESPPPAQRMPTREEVWQAAQQYVQKHNAEPVDQPWAARVAPELQRDLLRALTLSKTKASLGNLECRSTSCLGTLDWPTFAEARKGMMEFLTADTRVNCARSAMVPPDVRDDAPVSVELLYDCAGWKQEGSKIEPVAL